MMRFALQETEIKPGFLTDAPFQHFPADAFPTMHPVHWLHSHFAVGGWSPLQRLSGMLTSHIAKERDLLEQYQSAAERTGSAALHYLVNLLLEDEESNHRMFGELARALRDEIELSPNPTVPRLDFDRRNAAPVVGVAEKLLANERSDVRDLKRLRKLMRDVADTTPLGLLVELLIRATQNRTAVLKFAISRAEEARA